MGDCYCVDCRKSSGTSHCSHVVVPEAALAVSGEVTVYERPADSGNIVRRAFCGTCGSPIYSKNSRMPDKVFLRASVLDTHEDIAPQMTVYASRAPGWTRIDHTRPVFDIRPDRRPDAVS